jgi:hypothetical protein
MKIGSKISILLLAICQNGWAQGFINLDFEHPNLPLMPVGGFLSATNAIPGWTAYLDETPQGGIGYDGVSLGGAAVTLDDTNATSLAPAPIQGNYSILLQGATYTGGAGNPTNASVGQTGTIPTGAQSLTFWGSQFQVTFNGQVLSLVDISNALNYTVWGSDISSFAGQTGQLLFTAVADIPFASGGLLDNIQFSSLPVPEPTEFALGVLGALILGFHYRRNHPG